MNTDRRENLITLYWMEKQPPKSAQWKIIISETVGLAEVGMRVIRMMNNPYFLTTQRNEVLHFSCSPIIQPKHIFKCSFHLHYRLSNPCPRFLRTSLKPFYLMVPSNLLLFCIYCVSSINLFWKELWQNLWCNYPDANTAWILLQYTSI